MVVIGTSPPRTVWTPHEASPATRLTVPAFAPMAASITSTFRPRVFSFRIWMLAGSGSTARIRAAGNCCENQMHAAPILAPASMIIGVSPFETAAS